MAPLQGQTSSADALVPNVSSLNNLTRSPSHSSAKNDSRYVYTISLQKKNM